jgi:predicted dehydrogenase
MVADRVRVGVIGCGLIAQGMHLPYLAELSDRYELAAVSNVRESVAAERAARYGVPRVFPRWQDLVTEPIDAVVIATSGDHSPIAITAAQTGLHEFVVTPMALCSRDTEAMVQTARTACVQLMVGTMKRYDPAYEHLAEVIDEVRDLRLVRVTTLASPFAPYVAHYPLSDGGEREGAGDNNPLAAAHGAERTALTAAIGDSDGETRGCYRWILLDNLVHEFNARSGVLGEPTEVVDADLSRTYVSINLRLGETDCHISRVDLTGIARYRQQFAFYAPEPRLTFEPPSPFLRNAPSRLPVEGGETGTAHNWEREKLVSYEDAFKRELREFAGCVRSGREPRMSGRTGSQTCGSARRGRANQGLDPALVIGSAAARP